PRPFTDTAEVVIYDGASALNGGGPKEISRFEAYSGFLGGVFVASADLNGDGFAEVIVTPGLGGRGHLKVFDFADANGHFTKAPTRLTGAYTSRDYTGGARVGPGRLRGEPFVVPASGAGVPGDVRLFRNADQIGAVADGTPLASGF